MTEALQIRLLGAFQLHYRQQALPLPSSGSARSLLAYLILHPERAFSRTRLAGLFWAERPEELARRALSNTLWQLRGCLADAAARLTTDGESVVFQPDVDDWLDVREFEQLLDQHPNAPAAQGLSALQAAIQLYEGDLLADLYDDWCLLERERLRERYLGALEELLTLQKQSGAYDRALITAHRLVAADPLREWAQQELMRLYYLLERPRAALAQFEKLRTLLATELHTAPMSSTVALYHEIAAALEEPTAPYLPIEVSPPVLGDLHRLPFVGRGEERRELLHALKGALQGHGELVILRGAAGVGKSRLVGELIADAEWRGFQVGLAKVSPLGAAPPYQLLREALSSLLTPLRICQLAELVEARWLSALAPLFPAIREQLPDLPPLPPLDLQAEWQRLWEALAQSLRALAAITPLLLVLEDVHWADNASLAALPHLAAHVGDSQLLLVLTSRIVEAHERPLVLETLEAAGQNAPLTRITLPPFTSGEIDTLLHRALAVRTEDVTAGTFVEQLAVTTGGNALHLLESLKLLFEQGALTREAGGRWAFPEAELALKTPTSIENLVEERTARLPATTRKVLELVAVLGEDADFRVLAAAKIAADDGLPQHLERLQQRGFLRQTKTGYRFEHDLLQHAVYNTLSIRSRQSLHQEAAAILEELAPERVEALAYHFWAGGEWHKAAAYNRQAGRQAHAAYAGLEALEYYQRALDGWQRLAKPDPQMGLQIHCELIKVNDDLGNLDEAESHCRIAYALAENLEDLAAQANVLNALAYLHHQHGNFVDAEATALKALSKAEAADCDPEMAQSLFHRANAVRNQGRYPEALANYQRAIDIFEDLDNQERLADALNRMGYALEMTGAYSKAREVMEKGLTIRRRLDDKIGISYSLINLFAHHYYHGSFHEAQISATEATDICHEIGHPSGETAALHDLGMVALEKGDIEVALSYFARARTLAHKIGDQAMVAHTLNELGRLFLFCGDLERAREKLEAALGILETINEEHQMSGMLAPLALVCLGLGETENAYKHAQAALDLAEQQQTPWNLALAHRTLGELLAAEQETTQPVPHFEESIRIFHEIDSGAELARSKAAYARFLLRSSATSAERRYALSLVEEAQTTYEQKGMRLDLLRLEELLTASDGLVQQRVRLPRAGAPTGRPLTEDEFVEVTWTLTTPADDEIQGKAKRRRHRILRLLREAGEQGAEPTVEDLAGALEVSARTIKRDLAALRAAGHTVTTRGSRKPT